MTALALGLVLLAALAHASWNLLAKRAREKLPFLWYATLVSSAVYLPVGLWFALSRPVSAYGWTFVIVSSALECLYFWSLSQAYRFGDLALTYPVSRAVGVLLVPLLGAILLGERLSELESLGILLIVAGVVSVHLLAFSLDGIRALASATRHQGTRYALLTGLCVAAYSTLDKKGVTLVPPLLYGYCLHVGSALGLAALVLPGRRSGAAGEWKAHRLAILAVGILTPLAYTLVLVALTFTPVSYVAPAREVSVVIAAVLGVFLLREPYGVQRLFGSALITAGLFLLVAT